MDNDDRPKYITGTLERQTDREINRGLFVSFVWKLILWSVIFGLGLIMFELAQALATLA